MVFRIALRWRRGGGGGRGGSGSGSFFRSPASTGWCWMATGRGRSIATARMPRALLSVYVDMGGDGSSRCYRVKAEPQLVVETSEAATQKAKFRFQGLSACGCWSSHAYIKGRKVVGVAKRAPIVVSRKACGRLYRTRLAITALHSFRQLLWQPPFQRECAKGGKTMIIGRALLESQLTLEPRRAHRLAAPETKSGTLYGARLHSSLKR